MCHVTAQPAGGGLGSLPRRVMPLSPAPASDAARDAAQAECGSQEMRPGFVFSSPVLNTRNHTPCGTASGVCGRCTAEAFFWSLSSFDLSPVVFFLCSGSDTSASTTGSVFSGISMLHAEGGARNSIPNLSGHGGLVQLWLETGGGGGFERCLILGTTYRHLV